MRLTTIIGVFVVATSAAAVAQDFMLSAPFIGSPQLPQTIRLHDGHAIIGTGTVNYFPGELRIVVRLNNGHLLGTQVIRRDGSKTFYDPNGVISPPPSFKYEATETPQEVHPKPVQDALDAVKPDPKQEGRPDDPARNK